MYGERVEIPSFPVTETYPLTEARSISLAEAYGSVITGITTEEDIHELFAAQGGHLLDNVQTVSMGESTQYALRALYHHHKHETAFGRPETEASDTSARVLIPYVPQYGYLQRQEQELQKPLRMTFGLLRTVGTGAYVARANLWVAQDYTAPNPHGYRVLKDVTAFRTFDSQDKAGVFLNSGWRARARVGFVLDRLTG